MSFDNRLSSRIAFSVFKNPCVFSSVGGATADTTDWEKEEMGYYQNHVGMQFVDGEALFQVCVFLDEEAERNNDPTLNDYEAAGDHVLIMRKIVADRVRKNFPHFIVRDDLEAFLAEELDRPNMTNFSQRRYRSILNPRTQ